jgi:hypothetical protein
MLESMGIKGGITLYHVGYGGYGTTLSCPTISGVTSCCQPKCWLSGVGWVAKSNCDRIWDTGTPTCIVSVLNATSGKEVLSFFFSINHFHLSSTKGQLSQP